VSFTAGAIAAIAFALALILNWKGKGPKLIIPLMLIAGLGASGLLGRILDGIAGLILTAVGSGTQAAMGVAVPVIGVVAMGVIVWFDMRDGDPAIFTQVLALLFPPACMAVGGPAAALIDWALQVLGALDPFLAELWNSLGV
jgi:hypothetical protein